MGYPVIVNSLQAALKKGLQVLTTFWIIRKAILCQQHNLKIQEESQLTIIIRNQSSLLLTLRHLKALLY